MNGFTDKNKLLSELGELRRNIDEVDLKIVRLLCERYGAALEIAGKKRALGIPLENEGREKDVLCAACKASDAAYSSDIEAIFKRIISSSKAIQRKKLNLYFIGMPNCGKSRLSSRIGEILSIPCADTDELVMQRSGKSIDAIFDEDGETAFRELEHEVLCELAHRGGVSAATGGGIITFEKNLPVLKNSGLVVFLDRSLERLAMAKIRNRPLIREGVQAIISLYGKRIDSYRAAADLTVDPDAKGAVRAIVQAYTSATK